MKRFLFHCRLNIKSKPLFYSLVSILFLLFTSHLPVRSQDMSRDSLIWYANDFFNKSFNQARRNAALAQIYADSSKLLYAAAREPYGVARYDYLIGVIERHKGNFPIAKEHLNRFLSAATTEKDTLKMADTHFQLGTILQNQGLLDEAIEHEYASIRLYEAAGFPQYTADSYTNLGIIYRKLKQYEDSERQYRRALEIDEKLDDLDGQASNHANLGNLYAEQGRYEDAIVCYQRAMHFDSLNQSAWGLAYDHEDIGNMLNHQGNYRDGLNQHFLALGIRRQLPHQKEIAFSYQNIGNAYFALNQPDPALIYLDSAATIGQAIEAKELLSEIAGTRSKIYARAGNYRLAYAYSVEYNNRHDSLLNQGITDKINTLNAQFETEIKENQIALLNSENALKSSQLTAKKRQLTGLLIALILFAVLSILVYRLYRRTESQKVLISKNLDEKEILLREIHHRVKNNLQFISSLLNLQTEHVDDEKALSALQEGQDRVQSMALIHQNLYQEDNLTGVKVKDYFIKLIRNLFDSYNIRKNQIELELEVEDLNLDVDTVIPIGLIINELVSNSLKYAFPGKRQGIILIKLQEMDEQLELTVRDNGKGISSQEMEQLGSSFGYRLIKVFQNQLNAELAVKDQKGLLVEMKIRKYRKTN